MKTYILQKDLPDVKAGEEFTMFNDCNFYMTKRNAEIYFSNLCMIKYDDDPTYHMNIVENNPEWFKEKEQGFQKAIGGYIVSREQGQLIETAIFDNEVYYRYAKSAPPTWVDFDAEKQPLFKTEDGVDVYVGDEIYVVELPSYNICGVIPTIGKNPNQLYFSTHEKAEEYVIKNNPCLSYEEVFDFLEGEFSFPKKEYKSPDWIYRKTNKESTDALKHYIKSKLSQ